MEKIIQITSGKGPVECELAVAFALRELLKECREANIDTEMVHEEKGSMERTLSSVTVALKGETAANMADSWKGILLWTCKSPYRNMHKRKNWYVAVNVIEPVAKFRFSEKDVEFSTMRATGAGGQHVNKTNSAVRAVHIPSGVQVTAMESRSQHENKKLAIQKLKEKIKQWEVSKLLEQSVSAWLNHQYLERGKPRRIYEGTGFTRKNKNRRQDITESPCSTARVNTS